MIKETMFSKIRLLFLLLIVIIPTYFLLIRPGYFPMHDDMQAMRLLQMDKCIKDGQVPCRWVPDMGYGYGYPQFNYYAPFPYYIMEGFHLLGFGFLDSVKIGFIASSIVGAVGMFFLGSFLWGSAGGFISAFLYSYAPYRALDLYVRGAMGELWALAFLPFVFLGILKTIKGDKNALLLLAVSTASLFTSHNITAMISLPFIAIWILFWLFKEKKISLFQTKKKIFTLIKGLFWGLGLSSFFLLPALIEKKYVHVETILSGYFDYINHFLGLKQMLFQTQWGYGTSEVGPWDDSLLSVGIILWILPLIIIILFFILKRKEFKLILTLGFLGWISLFLTHPRSIFIWKSIPFLVWIQFPWRYLLLSTFLFAIVSGAVVLVFAKKSLFRNFWLIAIIVLVYFLNISYFRPRIWIDIKDDEKFSGKLWQDQQTISIFDYLPIFAEKPPGERAPEKPVVLDGEADVVSGKKGSNYQNWTIMAESDKAFIQLPLFYFPGWKVYDNGKLLALTHKNKLGLINFDIGKGENDILVKLSDTPVRIASNIITLLSLGYIPFYLKKRK